MERDELIKWMERVLKRVKHRLEEDGVLPPTALIFSEDNMVVVHMDFSGGKQKESSESGLRQAVRLYDADTVILAADMHVSIYKKDDPILMSENRPMPSQDPNSIDAIVVSGATPKESISLVLQYEKDKKGRYSFDGLPTLQESFYVSALEGLFEEGARH